MEKQHEGFGKMLSSIQEAIGALSVKQGEVQETMNKMEKSISSWRPQVDAAVQSLQRDMELLRNQVGAVERHQAEADKSSNTSQALEEREEIARRTSLLPTPPTTSLPVSQALEEREEIARHAPLLPTPPTASMPASTGEIGLDGHRISTQFRGRAPGVVTTLVPPPGKGTHSLPFPPRVHSNFSEFVGREESGGSEGRGYNHRLPKLDFPQFDDSDPQNWRLRCEHYFGVYGTHPDLWVRVATIYFIGRAASWLRSSRAHLLCGSWGVFCDTVDRKFDRNRHLQLVRQIDQLKQSGSVNEYYERFDDLWSQLLVYDPTLSTVSCVHRFTEGLRSDIKNAVLMHFPQDLETALALAILQEELGEAGGSLVSKDGKKLGDHAARIKGAYPLPLPPPKFVHAGKGDDKRAAEVPKVASSSDKLVALKAYRRAQGLCYVCAEKWSPTHKCSGPVQLHAVQELFSVLAADVSDGEQDADSTSSLMAISLQAIQGTVSAHTLRLQGSIQGFDVLILVDSGSSCSFLSSVVLPHLTGVKSLLTPIQVKVANGTVLYCTSELPAAKWEVQGHQFSTNFKLLPLDNYDMILGMDWLEKYSPMDINWQAKTIQFCLHDKSVELKGVVPELDKCDLVSIHQLQLLHNQGAVESLVQLTASDGSSSSQNVPSSIQSILDEFADIFTEPEGLPPSRSYDHTIPLIAGAQLVNIRPYRYTPDQKNEIEKQVQEMLKKGIIRPSSSPFSSPVLLVKKKDGTWRFCVDYRHLNAITIKNKYPLPVIDELLDELAGACWFSKLDLRSGYHQIRMAPQDEHKTAFKTHNGHFEFRVLPFGLTSAPATFQGVMNSVLAAQLRQSVLVFVDDILVYSRSLEEHKNHLRQVLSTLTHHQLKVKLSKCSFAQQSLAYLGHIISAQGVATDEEKIIAVKDWPTPLSVKDLRSFLGLTGYYRKFVRNYGVICKPLTNLLRKGVLFQWTSVTQEAFVALKTALIEAPVLALPNFQQPFVVETDASDKGIGAVLMQNSHPIAFLSKALGPRTQGLSTYEKESLAIMLAIDHWRSYLQHDEFVIRTDHRSLSFLINQRLSTPWQQKALTKLLGLRYKICYKKGLENGAADALSRRQSDGLEELSAISICLPDWLQELIAGYQSDSEAQKLLQALSVSGAGPSNFEVLNGILYFKHRIWIGHNKLLQQKILANLHTAAVGGHSGILVTYQRVKQLFSWPGLRKDVQEFVQHCDIFQRAKSGHVKYPGLLQPLEVPSQSWQVITMDFIEGLPRSASFDCILVIVDKFSKFAHFFTPETPLYCLWSGSAFHGTYS
ncbi:uncharacterized protein [Oryza sativa Japonica Group]